MKVVICGGGTAGHIHPGIALADELSAEKPDSQILFVGTRRGLETRLVSEAGYTLETISARGFLRQISMENIRALIAFFRGCFQARKVLKRFRPDIIVGFGGYVSAPPLFVNALTKTPLLIHEQNAIPGFTNKLLSRMVEVVAVSFPDTEKYFPRGRRVVFTGNPIRRRIVGVLRQEGLDTFSLDPERRTLLVFGGSRGARSINYALVEAYDKFREFSNIQILHVTGELDFSDIEKAMQEKIKPEDKVLYQCYPYLDNMNEAYSAADIVLSRAGATTLAEVTAQGIPSILVPYPYATNNHQEKNARALEKRGAARVLLDQDLNGETLFNYTSALIFNSVALQKMRERTQKLGRPFAANDLAKLVIETAKGMTS